MPGHTTPVDRQQEAIDSSRPKATPPLDLPPGTVDLDFPKHPQPTESNPDAGALIPFDPLQDFIRPGQSLTPTDSSQLTEFIRKSGASGASAAAAIARRLEALERGRFRREEDLDIQAERGLERTNSAFEGRGLFRSSAADIGRQRVAGDVERTRGRFLEDLQLKKDDIERRRVAGVAARARAIEAARQADRRNQDISLIDAIPGEIRLPDFSNVG